MPHRVEPKCGSHFIINKEGKSHCNEVELGQFWCILHATTPIEIAGGLSVALEVPLCEPDLTSLKTNRLSWPGCLVETIRHSTDARYKEIAERRNKETDRKATEASDGARLKRSNKLFELRRSPSKNDKL
ncbi:uncharacterized protein UDID_17848 [Ustilago sp. UG-2017a]|nr:uncharacterized protein UDID_17848 [Ustilago sp. UG-2017a]